MPSDQGRQSELVAVQIRRLVRRAEVLRQIHSDKMFRAQSRHRTVTVTLLVVTAAVGFVGFTGVERLQRQLAGAWLLSEEAVSMLYNLLVLLTVMVAIVIVVYQLPERAAHHHRSIQILSEFILDAENQLLLAQASNTPLSPTDLAIVTTRYNGISSSLPPISDKEFLASKARLLTKEQSSQRISSGAKPSAEIDAPTPDTLTHLLSGSPIHKAAFETLREVENEFEVPLYICGGFVRNLVWDSLHGYLALTPPDDIDVVFVSGGASPLSDAEILTALSVRLPNLPWSVQDLSLIRPQYGDGLYTDLDSALRDFPETASAVAVRQTASDTFEIVAPLGTGDLFSGLVRPTRHAALPRLRERASKKNWLTTWPMLQVLEEPLP